MNELANIFALNAGVAVVILCAHLWRVAKKDVRKDAEARRQEEARLRAMSPALRHFYESKGR
jgi:uncharacterized iron-regulated membrane protein